MITEPFTVTIDSLSYGGRGIGRRQDGKVAFVPFVIPGETVLARVEREHSSYCTASLEEILERSPERIDPKCPLFTQCGGCDWQHIPYRSQVEWKATILESEISRAAPLQEIPAGVPVPSESTYHYRGHTVLQCHGTTLGFFMKKTNRVIPAEECPVLNHRLQSLIPGLGRILRESPLQGIQSLELHAPHEETILEVRCGKGDKKAMRRVMERMHHELGIHGVSFVTPTGRQVIGKKSFSYPLAVNDDAVEISSSFGEFIQANLQVNQAMVDHVVHLASGSKQVIDLFCGSGNFSIPLARVSERVLAVEWSSGLVTQGRMSASRNKTYNIAFSAMEVRKALEEMKAELMSADTIVLDPPREGAKDAAALLPGFGASRIIYISCNPTTLARDLKPLIQEGYILKDLTLFDMFPQTYHVESVACLER